MIGPSVSFAGLLHYLLSGVCVVPNRPPEGKHLKEDAGKIFWTSLACLSYDIIKQDLPFRWKVLDIT